MEWEGMIGVRCFFFVIGKCYSFCDVFFGSVFVF